MPVEAAEKPVTQVVTTPEYIALEASKQGVDETLALYVWKHEGGENMHALGDMDITCQSGVNKGKPVRARGPWQLTDCYYPDVPDSCAFDLKCSTEIAVPLLKEKRTCTSQFSTCRDFYKQKAAGM